MEVEGIAIVGIAAQLPSGPLSSTDFDYASFWELLVSGGKAYEPLENVLPGFARANTQVKLPTQGSFLKNVESFDNISLGISTNDARMTPYCARRLLDLSLQALQDSGIESRRRNIGCFMSGNRPGHMNAPCALEMGVDAEGSFSGTPYSMANRISYALDLTGPSLQLDTGCSSSLTALHLAAAAIRQGDCEAAIVGAAQINRELSEWTTYVQRGILAADGMSRPLDAEAGGFGRGEAAIVVILKPLKHAIRDHDHIYSVVLGSAIKATGSQMPLYVPNGVVLEECIQQAFERSGLSPSDADYVELHATGTSVGDPIEANVAGRAFGKGRPEDGAIALGAMKGNTGHLEVAAFLAALVKACLIFEHGIIPPTVNLSQPARMINWETLNVTVPVKPMPLGCLSPLGRSIISISSFGIGGSMGHVVVQAPPTPSTATAGLATTAPILFLVGGLSHSAVDDISRGVLEIAADDPKTLSNCAVTLSRRARQLPWRRFFTVPPSSSGAATIIPREPFRLAYVFSGQGPQHLEMGRQLFAEYPLFRNTILELDDVYRRITGTSLIETTGLFASQSAPTITLSELGWPTTLAASSVAMVQIALCDLLKSVGVVPDMMMGHSAGETAAVYASGAGPKAMAIEIAIARGEAMTCLESEKAGMVSLGCSPARAGELIASVLANDTGVLEVSCFNAPDSVSVSGTAALLDTLVELAKQKNIFAQRIRTMLSAHSSFMDGIKSNYLAKMNDIFSRYPGPHVPQIPVYSTCRPDQFVDAFTPNYFWDNCRNPVLFSKAVSDALVLSPVFLEVGCHPVLAPFILVQGTVDNRVLCPMRRPSGKTKSSETASSTEPTLFLTTLGRLSLLGSNSVDLSGLYGASAFKSKLVEHPLVLRTILFPKVLQSNILAGRGPLSSAISKVAHPTQAEHVMNGEPIFPTTEFLEMASAPHTTVGSHSPEEQREGILFRVLELLEVEVADFDTQQPLTTYGLDSISAARLASILRPFATFSQLQLLGGITWSEIEGELVYSAQNVDAQGKSGSVSLLDGSPSPNILLDTLGVSPEDFSPHVPLSTYGMDLPKARRISDALASFITVTPEQLMSEMTWADLLAVAEAERLAQPLVQICHGSGTPIIILPAGNGSIGVFYSLQANYEDQLWGLQITDSTPMDSLMGLATFWKDQICARWPHGPYRIAAFCGSAIHAVAMVKMLEDAGEEVLQLKFIDHSPTLILQLEEMFRNPKAVDYETFRTTLVLDFLQTDPTIAAPILANYEAAAHDPATQISPRLGFHIEKAWVPILFEFLHGFYPTGVEKSYDSFIGPYDAWVSSVKARMAVLVAEWGAATSPLLGRWPDLGASLISKPVGVKYISGVGHFGIFGDARTAQLLARAV
ncbi:hypothetical protein C8R47DRAFT_640753 [Mycena vitilis]|nr:hypothetical protein C8R47DRAFT_640753 [Mycena vitilis]